MIKTACFQRDTDALKTRNDRKWKQFIVFPMFFPYFSTLTMLAFFDTHKPTKVNKLFGQTRKKSDSLNDLLPSLTISDKSCVLVDLVMLREFHWLKLISYYLLDRNE